MCWSLSERLVPAEGKAAILRPVRPDDLDAISALSQQTKPGLTSLSKDKDSLRVMVQHSVDSFRKQVSKPGAEFYLFVLEDATSGRVVGTSSILARTGTKDPFYSYEIENLERYSSLLNKRRQYRLLQLRQQRFGPSEIGTLYLHPDFRHKGWGRLLSFGRFLFIASFSHRFDPTIIAEMRGVSSDEGYSPFWDSLGRRFFDMPFDTADFLSATNKQFIAELMPRYPIYTDFLSEEARAVIGEAHELTKPALSLLLREGFQTTQHVDIFDAGPKIRASKLGIRAVRDSRVAQFCRQAVGEVLENQIIANDVFEEWRATSGDVTLVKKGLIHVRDDIESRLRLRPGESMRIVSSRANPKGN